MQATRQATPSAQLESSTSRWEKVAIGLVVAATGRAMTLAFVGRAGDGGVGDPPAAWLMPLVGDAAIGLSAPFIAFLLWRRPGPTSWLLAVVWSAVAVFDAAAAALIEISAPWPEFFMLETFGRSMFAMALGMHLVAVALLFRAEPRTRHGLAQLTRR